MLQHVGQSVQVPQRHVDQPCRECLDVLRCNRTHFNLRFSLAIQEAEAHNPAVEMEMWAIMEYCNRGTLQSGVDKVRRKGAYNNKSQMLTGALPSQLHACRSQHVVAARASEPSAQVSLECPDQVSGGTWSDAD